VEYLFIIGTVVAITDSISQGSLRRLGFSSSIEMLLPTSVTGLKALFVVEFYKKFQ